MAKRMFTKRQLSLQDRGPLPPSIPLIVPSNTDYDIATNQLLPKRKTRHHSELVVLEDALQLLCSLQKPVAVLSVCGVQHTGKSYLLSRLLGTSDAFRVAAPTQKPCTRGIWMSTIVFDCEDFALVFLDTEGIDVHEKDPRMLVMTTLLSSYLVYNSLQLPSRGPTATSEVEKMRPFTQLSKWIKLQAGVPTYPEINFRDHFPDFLWVTYHSHVKPTDQEGREILPTEYLKTQVLVKQSRHLDTISTVIHTHFPTVECKVLPKPAADPNIIKAIADNEEQLTPEFVSAVDNLLKYIQQQIQPKHGFTSQLPLDGPTLALLIKEYVSAMNAPKAQLCLHSAWHSVIDLRYRATVSNLLNEYIGEMEEVLYKENKLPLNLEGPALKVQDVEAQKATLMEAHYRILFTKVEALLAKARHLLPPEEPTEGVQKWLGLLQEFEKQVAEYTTEETADGKLTKVIKGGILQRFVKENAKLSLEQCTQVLEHLSAPICDRILSDQPYTYEDFKRDLMKLEVDYMHEVAGPAKWDALLQKEDELAKREKELEQIKGFVRSVFREQQQNCIRAIKLNDTNEQSAAQKSQVQMDNESKLQQFKILKNEQEEAIKRMTVAKKNHIDLEKQKYADLLAAGMRDAALKSEAKQKHLEELYDTKIAKLQSSVHDLEEFMKQCVKPPSPPQPHFVGTGICAVM